jgi:2-keto-3-deoxy-L-fuconate dehydrogenase
MKTSALLRIFKMSVNERLAGKRVLVTQADRFMGPAIGTLFREAGAEVVADERDLTRPDAVTQLADETGDLDVLVINLAAENPKTSIAKTTESAWLAMFEALVHPLYRLTRAFAPGMIDRGHGKIVLIGSASALRGMPNWSAYSAARGAQLSFVRAVGIELAPANVQVNGIAQSFVENPDYFPPDYQKTDEFLDRMSAVPSGRLASAREGALAALFLASDESDFFVGQILPFAGGWIT